MCLFIYHQSLRKLGKVSEGSCIFKTHTVIKNIKNKYHREMFMVHDVCGGGWKSWFVGLRKLFQLSLAMKIGLNANAELILS